MRDFRDSSRQTTSPAPPRHTPAPSPIMDSRHSSPTGVGEGVSCTEASGGSLACPALPCTLPPEATAKGTSGTTVASVSGTPETSLASKPETASPEECDPSQAKCDPPPSGNRNPEKNAQNPAESTSTGEQVPAASRKADPVLMGKPDAAVVATREFASCGSLGPGTPKKETPGNTGEGLQASSPQGGPTAGCSAKIEPGTPGTLGPGPADAAVPTSSAEPAPAPSGVTEAGSLGRGALEASAKANPEVLGAQGLGQGPREPAGGSVHTTLDGRSGTPSAQAAVMDGAAGAPQPVSPAEEGPGGGKPVSQGDTEASSGRKEPVAAGPGGTGGVEAVGASPAGHAASSSPSPSSVKEEKAGPSGEGASVRPSGEGPPGALGKTLGGSSGVPEGGGARAEPGSRAGAQGSQEAAAEPGTETEPRGAAPVGAGPGPDAQGPPPPPPQDAGTQAGAPVWACVSVALSPVAPAEGADGSAFGFQAPTRRDAGLQVSLGAAETRSVATGPMTPQAAAPPAFPEVRVRPGAGPTATANPEAAEPVRDVSWDEKGMTWEVYGAAMEVEVLGMAIQKHLERQIEEHGRQGGPAPAPPQPGPGPAARAPGPAKRPPGLFRALLQSVRRPRCCSRAGPTAE
ncbi:G protein-regulated inducer of neurite outgrowth 1 [Suncus etruscus]|uniref:G protein-regulated inducer of neurite outgrowth 1 n=1 Tax=Suncus etruscus TaxID=109475 RepID=UPI00210FBD12|nr:G protein-regulated inducer of neurite outgrowth 1 [Suncus etruscus]